MALGGYLCPVLRQENYKIFIQNIKKILCETRIFIPEKNNLYDLFHLLTGFN